LIHPSVHDARTSNTPRRVIKKDIRLDIRYDLTILTCAGALTSRIIASLGYRTFELENKKRNISWVINFKVVDGRRSYSHCFRFY